MLEPVEDSKLEEAYQLLGVVLRDNPEIWKNLTYLLRDCLYNAEVKLKSQSCEDRDFMAGYCSSIEDIFGLKDEIMIRYSKNQLVKTGWEK